MHNGDLSWSRVKLDALYALECLFSLLAVPQLLAQLIRHDMSIQSNQVANLMKDFNCQSFAIPARSNAIEYRSQIWSRRLC